MSVKFRVIDSGIADGRRQIAFDQALIELHKEGRIPDTVRFLQFPPTVLIGRHQILSHEVHLDYCRVNQIGLVRRITGGGAIYLDEGQLGWELVFNRQVFQQGSLQNYSQKICEAVASGLSKSFGLQAKFRGRNDIEVDGRKLCGTGGFFDGESIMYQGTVLVDLDPVRMVASLNVPKTKLEKHNLDSAEQRVVTLKELLDRSVNIAEVKAAILEGLNDRLDIETYNGEITDEERYRAEERWKDEIGLDEFVDELSLPEGGDILNGSLQTDGGRISTYLRLEGQSQRIREILFTGDFFVSPPRIVFDLEASLRGVDRQNMADAIEEYFKHSDINILTVKPQHFIEVTEIAISSSA